jgi:hypothetical protein
MQDDDGLVQKCELKWEPVNVALIEMALRRDALRRASCPGHELFEILYHLRNRATNVRKGKGVVAVVYREAASVGSLKNRYYTGIKGLTKIPAAVQAELNKGVPDNMAGVSTATFMRPIKYLCRHNFMDQPCGP